MNRYEDMIKNVHHRIDEYRNEQRAKRAKITKVAATITPVCAAAFVGVGLLKSGVMNSNHDQFIISTAESTTSNVIMSSDKDTATDKQVESDNNITNGGIESTIDHQRTTIETTITYATENSKSVTEYSKTDDDSVEVDTPMTDNKNTTASDTSSPTNTDAPVQQTTAPCSTDNSACPTDYG